MSNYSIDKRYVVDEGTEYAFGTGAYVRMKGEDRGTGQIVSRARSESIDPKTSKVVHSVSYTVHWLDQKSSTDSDAPIPIYGQHAQGELASSARGVPKITSVEDAEAWMASQVEGGNWTAKAQDAADSHQDWDVALLELTDEEKDE